MYLFLRLAEDWAERAFLIAQRFEGVAVMIGQLVAVFLD